MSDSQSATFFVLRADAEGTLTLKEAGISFSRLRAHEQDQSWEWREIEKYQFSPVGSDAARVRLIFRRKGGEGKASEKPAVFSLFDFDAQLALRKELSYRMSGVKPKKRRSSKAREQQRASEKNKSGKIATSRCSSSKKDTGEEFNPGLCDAISDSSSPQSGEARDIGLEIYSGDIETGAQTATPVNRTTQSETQKVSCLGFCVVLVNCLNIIGSVLGIVLYGETQAVVIVGPIAICIASGAIVGVYIRNAVLIRIATGYYLVSLIAAVALGLFLAIPFSTLYLGLHAVFLASLSGPLFPERS